MKPDRVVVEAYLTKPFYDADIRQVARSDRLAGFFSGPCCHFVIPRSGEVEHGRPVGMSSPAHDPFDIVIRVVGGVASAPRKSTGKPSWPAFTAQQEKALASLLKELALPVEDRR